MEASPSRPVALVTGANRGLGLETCRQLVAEGFRVVVTSRRARSGMQAALAVDPSGREVLYHPLDVTDRESITGLVENLRGLVPRLDALVNNAGIGSDSSDPATALETVRVNYSGPRDVTEALLPAMGEGGRVVMVSSGLGELSTMGPDLRRRFADESLTRPALDALVSEYLDAVRRGGANRLGWPSAYSVSKVALNALTRILARDLADRGIAVNAVCPGWVRTDMGGRSAPRSVAAGARSITLAVTLPKVASGGFYRDGKEIPW